MHRSGNGYTRVAGDSESERSGAEDLESDPEEEERGATQEGEGRRSHSEFIY